MKSLLYKLTFFSYWHCGSGQSAGADVDALVIKDRNGLPFVPGKTIKGLVREAAELIASPEELDVIGKVFGQSGDVANYEDIKKCAHFTNATIEKEEGFVIVQENLANYMYHSIASTAIDNNGIAKDNTLRKMEVTMPCTLYGQIDNVEDSVVELLRKSLMFIKRMGTNRNRGMGRCQFELIKEEMI